MIWTVYEWNLGHNYVHFIMDIQRRQTTIRINSGILKYIANKLQHS